MYEKLGTFYLGKSFDIDEGKRREDLVLYDSKDLTTHAMIIGMTGSGKTGLGIGLIEEALIDNVPVIAIDPKGDLPNLMLTFPQMQSGDFLPWINKQDAVKSGATPEQHAQKMATLWKNGLADWGQSLERVQRLKDAAEFVIYTPGSSAGRQVNVLRSFAPPSTSVMEDPDLLKDRIQNTSTILLSLMGIDVDPLTSPEHILISNIFESSWSDGKTLTLGTLIQAIQNPPFQRIGVMDIDSFFPARERFGLAMRLNNLLAAPGFESWMSGDPLDISKMLYSDGGKPRASIFTISHLSPEERMFFVSSLLNEILSWVRSQSGTSSLRAILYMDEIFGYFPPVRNPPSKKPLLTLLKQARAYGLGIVLSTQNPVDLDYKGLSNTGTWMIGRLQTERDKERVLAGLEGVSGDEEFDRNRMEKILSGLGKRIFLLHNVHESRPEIFQTRWVLSYLSGPMTRDHIKKLMAGRTDPSPQQIPGEVPSTAPGMTPSQTPPAIPPGIDTFYIHTSGTGHGQVYIPTVLGRLDVQYASARYKVDTVEAITIASEVQDGPVPLDWDNAFNVDFGLDEFTKDPAESGEYVELPSAARKVKNYVKWNRDLKRWVIRNRPLKLLAARKFKCVSELGETEGEFRARLALLVREKRDLKVEKIRRKYSSKFNTLQNRLIRAEQAIAREKEQSKGQKLKTAISFGTALLGSFLGRKKVSASSARSFGTAMKSATRMQKESMDVKRATAIAEKTNQDLENLELQLQDDIQMIESQFDPATEELEEILIKPKSTGITMELFGLTWMPYRKNIGGTVSSDW
jgi:Helicase HerA, central domain